MAVILAEIHERRIKEKEQEIAALRAENGRLRAALSHYADERTWCERGTGHYLTRQEGQTEDCEEVVDTYNGEGRGYVVAQQALREDGEAGDGFHLGQTPTGWGLQ